MQLVPEFAIKPRAIDVSSTEKPKAPATGATYLKDSPNIETFVFALVDALARTSAKCDAFETSFTNPSFIIVVVPSAANPKAVIASVTISEVVAKSNPSAAARFIMPSILCNISSVFHPAIAI